MPAEPSIDLAACEQLMRGGSKSFFAASGLLPKGVRIPAIALYAFCRVADDAVDDCGSDMDACAHAMDSLRARLDAIYAGEPGPIIEDRAMAMVMGVRDAQALARACELGNAMQLTNIARDVGEDAANGRLYLPQAWLREAGIDPNGWLARPVFSEALAGVVGRLLLEADRLYRLGSTGIAALPRDCRGGILAASMIYADIGGMLSAQAMDSVNRRAVVGSARKLTLLCLAKARAQLPMRCSEAAPLPSIRFLADAGAAAAVEQKRAFPRRSFDERCEWMIDLFERVSMPPRTY